MIVTVAGDGTLAGGEYTPDAEIVPTVALPLVTLLTCQVTVPFELFDTVAVKVCVPDPAGSVAVLGDTDTLIMPVVVLPPFAHAFVPAVDGAVVDAAVELTTTSAVSCRPILSVTVSRTVYEPDEGAVTVAVSVLAPTIETEPLTTVHAYEAIVRLHAAALPAPCKVTL